MAQQRLTALVLATGMFISLSALAERAEVIEYNPNIPLNAPAVQPASAVPEVGMLGYVNEKFNRMERQIEDSADRMDRLERDSDRLRMLETKVQELEKKLAALSTASAATSTVTATNHDAKTSATPVLSNAELEAAQEAYKKAFDQLMAGKYPEAGKLFKAYLEKYPETDQSSNAHYWLGETYFVGRKFDLAAKSFAESAKLDGPKSSDALLKEGQCHLELKKEKDAKASFDELKKRFPDSPAARQIDKVIAAFKKS